MLGTDATFPLCVATSSKLPADPAPKRSKNRGHWSSTVLTTSCPRVLPLLSSIPTFSLMPHRALFLNSGARVPPAFRPHTTTFRLDSLLIVTNRLLQDPPFAGLPTSPLSLFPSQTLCIHTLPNSLSLRKTSTPLESSKSKLFCQNTRGGVPLKRCAPPQQASLLALCFHGLTNSFSRNPFVLLNICVAPGVGVGHHKIALAA